MNIALINQILVEFQPLIIALITMVLIPQLTMAVRKGLSLLPVNRRALLASIVSTAVTAVEQVTGTTNDTPAEKQALALKFIHAAIKALPYPYNKLQVPDSELIPLIEEAVFLLHLAEGKTSMSAKVPCPDGTESAHKVDKVK